MATVSDLREHAEKAKKDDPEVEPGETPFDDDNFPDDDEPQGSIEDQLDDPDSPTEPDAPTAEKEEETIPGVNRQLSLLAGGEEPDSSSFKMRGGSIPVEGEFVKGDIVKVMVTLTVDEVHFIDKKDKDGYVVGTERRHIAKPLSIRRV